MYLTPWAAVALFLLAAVGSLSILASVGVWIFTSRLPEAHLPADEVVAAHTGNVRVIREVNAAPTLPVTPVSDGFMRGVVDGGAS